jgi:hypothetical protein
MAAAPYKVKPFLENIHRTAASLKATRRDQYELYRIKVISWGK